MAGVFGVVLTSSTFWFISEEW